MVYPTQRTKENSMVTLKDIAKACNVSVATVSIVLSNRPHRFSSETVAKIIEYANQMNYVPNSIAQSLVTKRTRIIGLIIPDVNNIFYLDFITEVEKVAKARGYTVVLVNSQNDGLEEVNNYKTFIARRIDATIILRAGMNFEVTTKELSRLAEKYEMPTLCLCNHIKAKSVLNVFSNQIKGSYLATQHLIRTNHKRIGFIRGPQDVTYFRMRFEGFMMAVSEANLSSEQYMVVESDFNYDTGREQVEELINAGCDAIYAGNDMLAFTTYQVAHERGLTVGKDISIMGHDDVRFASIIIPSLSTVHQPMREIAEEGVTALLNFVEGIHVEPYSKEFDPSLILRNSIQSK